MLISSEDNSLISLSDKKALTSAKYGFLILAHNDVAHCRRLINSLGQVREFMFLVHIDAKANIEEFALSLRGLKNVYLLLDRVNVMWGGFSQVEAMLKLLTVGLAFPATQRFTYLSGADYPLRAASELLTHFEKNSDTSYVPCVHVDKSSQKYDRFVNVNINGEVEFLNMRGRQSEMEIQLRKAFISNCYKEFKRNSQSIMSQFIPYKEMYSGSQWVSLTRVHSEYLMQEISGLPNIGIFFRYTVVPDESFIHTILMNSPYAAHNILRENMHEILWKESPTDKGAVVVTYTEQHLDFLKSSRKWFARKFSTQVSADLLERLDEVANV